MRVAIVNDMPMAVESLARMLRHSEHDLAWCAYNGAEAVKLSAIDPPDLILMDLVMPVMNGVEATRRIMQSQPCPILIVTASIEQRCDIVFEAMGAGAMDAVATPNIETGTNLLLKKIALLGLLRNPVDKFEMPPQNFEDGIKFPAKHLVVIGSSSGGPAALATLLSRLPEYYHSPIVVLQHIDAQFAPQFALWLNEKTPLNVKTAREGDLLQAGHVYIAASDDHLMLNSEYTLYYNVEPRETYYRPSVDVFFHSVAKHWKYPITAILLTGMGQDGAQGLLELRGAGAYTIAQDESTSAVFGMPKVAARSGAAVEVLPIQKIADVLCESALEKAKRCKIRRSRGV
jgi:chemotaxis response regulator CheB